MTGAKARRLTGIALLSTGVLVTVRDVSEGRKPSVKNALGLLFAGVVLSLLSEGAPAVAGGLALLLLTSSIFSVGGTAFTKIGDAL